MYLSKVTKYLYLLRYIPPLYFNNNMSVQVAFS